MHSLTGNAQDRALLLILGKLGLKSDRQHGKASLSTANFEESSTQENHLEQNITEETTTELFEDCHLK